MKDQLRDQALAAVRGVPGVTDVAVEMTASVRSAALPDGGRAPIPGIRNIIAVGAGKGGVGKTTVAVNLAIALARLGSRVGIIDGDIYGPNVPIMLGVQTQLQHDGEKIVPAEKYGISAVSMGFLTSDDAPVIWRGPMLHGVVNQFFRDVRWPELDYLIVDMPPGTGDVALSLSQSVPVSGAVVVTTPQRVSLADTRRAVKMYEKLNAPVLGLIENMSHFVCPGCGREADLFGRGGGEAAGNRARHAVPRPHSPLRAGALGRRRRRADRDRRARVGAGAALVAAAERVAARISIASYSRTIPLTPVR